MKPNVTIELPLVENLWIEIEINKKKLTIGVVYRHPDQTVVHFDLFFKALTYIFHELNFEKSGF